MVAAEVDGPPATRANLPAPKDNADHPAEDGRVRDVQVMPSGDVAAAVEEVAMATKLLFP